MPTAAGSKPFATRLRWQTGDVLLDMLYLRALGIAELGADRFEEADEHLGQALDRADQIGVAEPAIWRIDGDAIEAALGAGALERARELVARFEERAERSRIPWSLAVSARCRGSAPPRESSTSRRRRWSMRCSSTRDRPVPFESARTLLAYGRVQRRRKQRRDARASLDEAREIFARLGADAWTCRTDEELGGSRYDEHRRRSAPPSCGLPDSPPTG